MGNKSSLLLREEEIAQIQEETGCKYLLSFLILNNKVTKLERNFWENYEIDYGNTSHPMPFAWCQI